MRAELQGVQTMASCEFRAFRSQDLNGLLAALAVSAPADAVTEERFRANVLLDTNFQADGLMVADVDGEVVGAIYAVAPISGLEPLPADGGWITFFFVHPAWRNRGIGSELVSRAVSWLSGQGAAWINFSGYAPAYFLPGLDEQLYPEAMRVLSKAGFSTQYSPVAMDANLAVYRTPTDVLELKKQREADGYRFLSATAGDLPETIAFATEKLAADWGKVIRESVLLHGHPERVLISRDPAGTVVGFATYGSYGGIVERFGPFGVDENQRGTGLGKILLHLTLSQMRSEGAHSAWFLWTGEKSPAGQLYLKSDFTVTRTFRVMQLDTSASAI